jgi:hypothetical protein
MGTLIIMKTWGPYSWELLKRHTWMKPTSWKNKKEEAPRDSGWSRGDHACRCQAHGEAGGGSTQAGLPGLDLRKGPQSAMATVDPCLFQVLRPGPDSW